MIWRCSRGMETDMEPHVFIFPGELISSKNGRRQRSFKSKSGKKCLAPVKSKLAYEDEMRIRKRLQDNPGFVMQWQISMLGKRFPVRIKFMIYRKSHRVFDYINIIQNLCDCIVKEGLLPDDSAKYLIPDFEPYQVDAKHPRTELTIV